MTSTEHSSKAPHSTGIFAVLRAFLHVQGSGARIAALFTIVAGMVAFTAAPALAKEVHIYSTSFGSAGSGPGQFKEPAGVAVNDETGDVYVVDKGNNRVEYFSETGAPEGQFNDAGALSKPEWIAVDNSSDPLDPSKGDVYVTENTRKVIDKFSATGEYLGQITDACPLKGTCPPTALVPFSELYGVAVDPAGRLWVYQSTKEVDDYSDAATNVFLESREAEDPIYGAGSGFAVGPEDEFYANLNIGPEKGVSLFTIFAQFANTGGFAKWAGDNSDNQTAAVVDFANHELYIDYGTTVTAADPSTETLIETFGSGHLTDSAGVAVNSSTGGPSSNDVYVSDGAADRVVVFDATEVADTTTEPPSPITKTEATLHGTVNPEGLEVKSCEFEYGTEPGIFPHTEGCSTPPGKGIAPVPEQAKLKGLLAGTTYYYRLTATNANGIPGSSAEEHFATLPAVDALSTGPSAENVTPNTAKLTGTLSPDGTDAHYFFQYGTSTNYGHVSPARPGTDAGTVSAAVPAETNLAELTAGTTYDFRLVGVNSYGTTYGENVQFTTPAAVEAVSTGPAEEVTGNAAKLTGSLSPDGTDAHYYFEYGTEAGIYGATAPALPGVDAGQGGAECLAPGGPPNCSSITASTVVSALTGGTVYHYRLVTVNAFGTTPGQEQTFTTETTPVVSAAEAKEVSSSQWDLTATVNPEGLGLHSCTFEYGTSTTYEASVPCEQTKKQIGDGTTPVPVSVALSELEPNTTYHWRLVVSNTHGSSLGSAGSADHTFVYSTAGSELPDHRAYEMVTPPFKNGALFGAIFFGFPASISEDGSRVIALTIQCFSPVTPVESCTVLRRDSGEPFEFTRTSSGWETSALAPSAQKFSENTIWALNASEGDALFSMPTGLSSEDEWYARTPDPEPTGSFSAIGPATPPGVTGTKPIQYSSVVSTADLSHLVWSQGEYQERYYWPFDETTHGSESLFEYAGAGNKEPFLVGVTGGKENGKNYNLISACGTTLGTNPNNTDPARDALSADGRTVYFTAQTGKIPGIGLSVPCPGGSGANAHTPVPVDELYARVDGEEPDAHTVAISQPDAPQTLASTPVDENCASEECHKNISEPANWRDAKYGGASEDGSHVFFTSTQQLTDDATQGAGSAVGKNCATSATTDCNLYVYDFDQPAGHNLIDVSAPETSGEGVGGPRVQGLTAVSADGSHVYFVAQGVLTSAPNDQGQPARSGRDNLYVYERDARYPAGHTAFVASLAAADKEIGGEGRKGYRDWTSTGNFTANVTPDGRFLVFESVGDLTPDAHGGGAQIYRYDAATEQLVRISIGEDGFDDNGNADADAYFVPAFVGEQGHLGPARGDPTMSNDGSFVFFESPAALTPRALNYTVVANVKGETKYAQNVYEWHEGQVYLISDGHDAGSADIPLCSTGSSVCLRGSDASGHNVFFTTADRLVPKDTDTQVDIYDARICEPEAGNPCISEPSPPLPPCNGESCHGIPAATPSLLAPGSATFNGEGNVTHTPPAPAVKPKSLTKAQKLTDALKQCKKDKNKKKRATCEKQAKQKYGAAKKSSKKKGK